MLIKVITNLIIRFLLIFICRVDKKALLSVPKQGPAILIGNHVNFLDAPIAYSYLFPRDIISLVKEETFNNPLLKFLFKTWGSIPIKRATADFEAINNAIDVLNEGKFLAIAPEGTRTKDGRLIQAHTGIVIIALKSKVPIIPIVQYGGEKFLDNIKKLQRTKITMQVGKPFIVYTSTNHPGKEERQQITNEIMYQLALLMPEEYRGHYSDLNKMTTDFLNFDVNIEKSTHISLREKVSNTIRKYFSTAKNPAA